MNLVEEIVDSRRELESPLSFWMWAALVSISAVVKDSIYLDRQIYKLYPNIYVMLHADSGLKKGPPIALSRKLVSTVNNTKVISGRSSIQGILKDMGTVRTKPGGKIEAGSSVFICSSELTSSLVEDKVATTILTDLYDRQYNEGKWRSLLKMEEFSLKDPTVTMFTATNEAHSSDFFARKDIQGGYFARTFIVTETEENRPNSLSLPLKRPIDDDQCIKYLKNIGQLKGAFKSLGQREKADGYEREYIDPQTGEVGYYTGAGYIYEDWYQGFKSSLKIQLNKDDTGTLNRFGDSVLKIAMLLSLAKKPELEISAETMEQSILIGEKLVGNVKQATLGAKGLSDSSPFKTKLIMELLNRENHQISKTMLMKKMLMHYKTAREFDEIMNSIEATGVFKQEMMGNQVIYTMPRSEVILYERMFAGKLLKG